MSPSEKVLVKGSGTESINLFTWWWSINLSSGSFANGLLWWHCWCSISETALLSIMFCQEIYFNLRDLRFVIKPHSGLECVHTFTTLIACLHSGHNSRWSSHKKQKWYFYLFFFQSIISKVIFINWMFFKNSFNSKNNNNKKNIWFVLHAWRHNFPIYSRGKSLSLWESRDWFSSIWCTAFHSKSSIELSLFHSDFTLY